MDDLFSNNYKNDESTTLTEFCLRGEIKRVVYEDEEKGFAIIKVNDNQGKEQVIKGNIIGAYEGQAIEAKGVWETHKEYGKQFKVTSFKFTLPTTKKGIRAYLASGVIHGIGKKIANDIVDKFGLDTLEIMDKSSKRLLEVSGFGKKRLATVQKAWKESTDKRELFIFLQGLSITPAYCHRLYKNYGDATAEIIKETPYRVAEEVHGMGFKMADNIAYQLGIEKNDKERILAGISYALLTLQHSGHVCYPEDRLIDYTVELLDVEPCEVRKGLKNAESAEKIIIEEFDNCHGESKRIVYDVAMFVAEKEVAFLIDVLSGVRANKVDAYKNVPLDSHINFNKEQLKAIDSIGTYPLNIITGGPGVGKTTVIEEIVRRAKIARLWVYLAAPTGRAAKRLSESSKMEAMTIHRMLKWDPAKAQFVYGTKHPLNCDILIVDEISMLDIQLAQSLLRAIRKGTVVVFVGDADQLPSVGPGRVLKDFIYSGKFSVTHLSQIYRQGAESKIIVNAHRVNNGEMPDFSPVPNNCESDFYWIEEEDGDKAVSTMVKMIKERIPQKFKFDSIKDIQVLTPMRKGNCGTLNINYVLQHQLNDGKKPMFKFGERFFKVGDKVMQTSNNYDKKVFNGDMGFITQIVSEDKQFFIRFEKKVVQYEYSEAEEIVHSYAVTIHKSQGSEFPVVIMPILNQHFIMLQRNLIYTGMTRAKKLLILVGSKKAVSIAVNNYKQEIRYSMLLLRLKNKT